MKVYLLSYTFLFLLFSTAYGQQHSPTILLNKQEFLDLSGKDILIPELLKKVFGTPTKQNFYKLAINEVDVSSEKISPFKYYPLEKGSTKKSILAETTAKSVENTPLTFSIKLDAEASVLTPEIKAQLGSQNSIVLNIVVIGDPRIFVTQAKDKAQFIKTSDEQSFAEDAFVYFFGENPKKMNYSILVKKTKACLLTNLNSPCTESFELNKTNPDYSIFSGKITSKEFSAGYILFDIPINREGSKLTADIEKMLTKEKDGSEHLKFYYCIPKDNLRPKKKKLFSLEGKILSGLKKPMKNLMVYLRDGLNSVIASQPTDTSGYFVFSKLPEGRSYSIYIDNSCKEPELILVSRKDKFITTLKRTDIGFEYKILDADLQYLTAKDENDPSEEFLAVIKGRMVSVSDKIAPLKEQTIELKSADKQVMQTKKTDKEGNFEFTGLDPEGNYELTLPDYKGSPTEKLYLANSKNELITAFHKNPEGIFEYKILAAELVYLADKEVTDLELAFSLQKKTSAKEIVIRDFIYYDLNSYSISTEAAATLQKIAKIATENSTYHLEIVSHTDCSGEQQDNLKLSQKRSESVAAFLSSKNIDPNRLKALGLGESKPLNECSDGKLCIEPELKMNRRTEFRFYQ